MFFFVVVVFVITYNIYSSRTWLSIKFINKRFYWQSSSLTFIFCIFLTISWLLVCSKSDEEHINRSDNDAFWCNVFKIFTKVKEWLCWQNLWLSKKKKYPEGACLMMTDILYKNLGFMTKDKSKSQISVLVIFIVDKSLTIRKWFYYI